jgi:hypothetical protein
MKNRDKAQYPGKRFFGWFPFRGIRRQLVNCIGLSCVQRVAGQSGCMLLVFILLPMQTCGSFEGRVCPGPHWTLRAHQNRRRGHWASQISKGFLNGLLVACPHVFGAPLHMGVHPHVSASVGIPDIRVYPDILVHPDVQVYPDIGVYQNICTGATISVFACISRYTPISGYTQISGYTPISGYTQMSMYCPDIDVYLIVR